MIETRCLACNRVLSVQDNLLGKLMKCPHCQAAFVVEQVSAGGSPKEKMDEDSFASVKGERPLSDIGERPTEITKKKPDAAAKPVSRTRWFQALAKPLPRLSVQVFGIVAAIVIISAAIGYGVGNWLAAGMSR